MEQLIGLVGETSLAEQIINDSKLMHHLEITEKLRAHIKTFMYYIVKPEEGCVCFNDESFLLYSDKGIEYRVTWEFYCNFSKNKPFFDSRRFNSSRFINGNPDDITTFLHLKKVKDTEGKMVESFSRRYKLMDDITNPKDLKKLLPKLHKYQHPYDRKEEDIWFYRNSRV